MIRIKRPTRKNSTTKGLIAAGEWVVEGEVIGGDKLIMVLFLGSAGI